MKKNVIIVGIVMLVAAGGLAAFLYFSDQNKPTNQTTNDTKPKGFDKSQFSIDEPGSLWWIVNKNRPLPKDYEPASMVAPNMKLRWASIAESMQVSSEIAPSLESMYQATKAAGFDVILISGFRSYTTQAELYNGYVKQSGQEYADKISARPGTSEHQTGLVVDIGRSDQECELEQCFGELPEGRWLAEHAHEFGFIIRYPKDKETIVGYTYEPWHLRYVGKELALELRNKGKTLEEFFGL